MTVEFWDGTSQSRYGGSSPDAATYLRPDNIPLSWNFPGVRMLIDNAEATSMIQPASSQGRKLLKHRRRHRGLR
jgi:hypothetical protein